MDISLLAGLWLPASIWDDVANDLTGRGHRCMPVKLPGVDDASPTATLDDQLLATLQVVDVVDRSLVVGHSAAATLAWMVADRRPEHVAGVVMIGGFPTTAGNAYADFFPIVDGLVGFPGWESFEGADSADLDATTRERVAEIAIPVPVRVAQATVDYGDERRFSVPVTVVCPEFDPEQARRWIASGDVPELAHAEHVDFVDIDSGHWPMLTRPGELARILDDAARAASAKD